MMWLDSLKEEMWRKEEDYGEYIKMIKNKRKSPSSFSLMNCLSRNYFRDLKYINSSKIRKGASDKVALMIRPLPNQGSLTDRGIKFSNYINLSKGGESASVDLMVRPLSDKQSSLTGIPGSIPGTGASMPLEFAK